MRYAKLFKLIVERYGLTPSPTLFNIPTTRALSYYNLSVVGSVTSSENTSQKENAVGTATAFRTIVGRASRDAPRDMVAIYIDVREQGVTTQEARESLKARVRLLQANIDDLTKIGVELGEHERHDGLPQTVPHWRYDRDNRQDVTDGFICSWQSVLQTAHIDKASDIVERLSKGLEEAKNLSIRARFYLAEETNKRVNGELFNTARDDARSQLSREGQSLGFDPARCRLVSYGYLGDPTPDYRPRLATRRMTADAGDDDGGERQPLELHPGTESVAIAIAFTFEMDEAVFFANS